MNQKSDTFTWANANEVRVSDVFTGSTIFACVCLAQLLRIFTISSIKIAQATATILRGRRSITCSTIFTLI